MIAFRVKVNGRKIATAGLSDYHLVSADITWFQSRAAAVTLGRPKPGQRPKLSFSVRGLLGSRDGTYDHFSWASLRSLRVGDTVSLQVVEASRVDDPTPVARPHKKLRGLKKGRGTRAGDGKRHNQPLQSAGRVGRSAPSRARR